jgi:AcrR family transcriptional regulator
VSPQHSNRPALVEGTLRCLERLPPERVTARAIADESGANLASIAYHFGSKDALVTKATIAGLDRWLEESDRALDDVPERPAAARLGRVAAAIETSRRRHTGLARAFAVALARAQHDPRVREMLAEGFRRTRPRLAAVLRLGDDETGEDAAGLVHSMFAGLLLQTLLDESLAIDGTRMRRAQARLRAALPARA